MKSKTIKKANRSKSRKMLAPAAALGSRCRHNAIDYWMLYGRALAPVGVPAVYKGIAQEPTTASWSSCSRQSRVKYEVKMK